MHGEGARLTVGHGVHLVQFYGDDGELAVSVGGFLAEGLARVSGGRGGHARAPGSDRHRGRRG